MWLNYETHEGPHRETLCLFNYKTSLQGHLVVVGVCL